MQEASRQPHAFHNMLKNNVMKNKRLACVRVCGCLMATIKPQTSGGCLLCCLVARLRARQTFAGAAAVVVGAAALGGVNTRLDSFARSPELGGFPRNGSQMR